MSNERQTRKALPPPKGWMSDDLEAAVQAGEQVQKLLDSPGWQHLLSVLDAHLERERIVLYGAPQPVENHERHAAKTIAYGALQGIAEGVVTHGRKARERMNRGSD